MAQHRGGLENFPCQNQASLGEVPVLHSTKTGTVTASGPAWRWLRVLTISVAGWLCLRISGADLIFEPV